MQWESTASINVNWQVLSVMLRVIIIDSFGQIIISRVENATLAYDLINSIKDIDSYVIEEVS